MEGDHETGVAVMRIAEGLDSGPVCLVTRVPIGPEQTAGELHDGLAVSGAKLMVEALAKLGQGSLSCEPQDDAHATYAAKLDSNATRIDWAQPAAVVHNAIRGLSPIPGAWFELDLNGKRERIKVLRSVVAEGSAAPGMLLDQHLTVACGDGAVRLTEIQRAGKKPMRAQDFLRGVTLPPGTRLP
jgi:methionyl-tRNA formyltransferase